MILMSTFSAQPSSFYVVIGTHEKLKMCHLDKGGFGVAIHQELVLLHGVQLPASIRTIVVKLKLKAADIC